MYEMVDEFTQGWIDADEQIQRKLKGERITGLDYSQGNTKWDNGWNARLEMGDKL